MSRRYFIQDFGTQRIFRVALRPARLLSGRGRYLNYCLDCNDSSTIAGSTGVALLAVSIARR